VRRKRQGKGTQTGEVKRFLKAGRNVRAITAKAAWMAVGQKGAENLRKGNGPVVECGKLAGV